MDKSMGCIFIHIFNHLDSSISFHHPIHTMDLSMGINPWKSIHEKSIHGNQSMKNPSMRINP
jgi:hypothetical protein